MKPFIRPSVVPFSRSIIALAGLFAGGQLSAQSSVTYADAETNSTAFDTSSPLNPLTLNVASGTATQTGIISGSGSIIKTGSGTLTLSGTNTYTGSTTVTGGVLQATGAALNNTAVQLTGGTWRVNGNTQSIANAITASGNSGLTFGTGSNFINGSISSIDSNAVLTIAQGNGGSNTVTLFGSLENYTGTLILNNKFYRLQAQSSGYFDTTSGRNALWQINTGAQLSFQAGSNTNYVVRLGALQGAGTLSGGAGAGSGSIVYEIGARGTNTEFSGLIIDGLTKTALTKVGSASFTLSGANTYTGGTVVQAGILALGANEVLADSGSVTFSGGTLALKGFSETAAGLILTAATSSQLDFGEIASTINFTSVTGTGTLSVLNLTAGVDHFFVTNDPTGVLSQITINGLAAQATNAGSYWEIGAVSAIPEPSTFALIAGVIGVAVVVARRRR